MNNQKENDSCSSFKVTKSTEKGIIKELELMDNEERLMILAIGKTRASHIRVQKTVFLISKLLNMDMDFVPYKLGMFSERLMEKLENSQNRDLITKEGNIFYLTKQGLIAHSTLVHRMKNKGREDVLFALNAYNNTNDFDLTAISYYLYPESLTESEIKEQIIKRIKELKRATTPIISEHEGFIEVDA